MTQLTLDCWLRLLEQRHPTEIELGLERVGAVAALLGLGSPARQVVVVAGTNGKGSCIAVMDYLLRHRGLRVGTYTSPHLLRYNERITLLGKEVLDTQLCAAFQQIEQVRGDTSLTYFEFGTLAALCLMAESDLDVALLEVGLGGRLDAVNIIDGDVAVVTSIALDHQNWLGDSREAIALEKIAVARPDRPVVCGELDPPQTMLDFLAPWGPSAYHLGRDGFGFSIENGALALQCKAVEGHLIGYTALPATEIPLASIACAVQALVTLGHTPTQAQLTTALKEVHVPGRMHWLTGAGSGTGVGTRVGTRVGVVLDVAHNPAATTLLARQLSAHKRGRVVAVFAAMDDKDIGAMVASMAAVVDHWLVCNLPGVTRAASVDRLASVLSAQGLHGTCHEDVGSGYTAGLKDMGEEDILVVFGSFYTVAAVLRLHREKEGVSE